MPSWRWLARACAAGALLTTLPIAALAQTAPALIPAIQVDGRGHGHGVGMAQDGALAMGKAGANVRQILGQFYPGTAIGKATGAVRVPVISGDNITLSFPEGGEVRGSASVLRVAPGASAVFTRVGDGTRVRTSDAPPPAPTSSTTPATTTTTTTEPPASPDTTLLPKPDRRRVADPTPTPTTAPPAPTTSTTIAGSPTFAGPISAVPAGEGRVGVIARNRRYRGIIEVAPVQRGLRFVNQVNVETYLRGMGEVRNPSWPAASLQAQAIAARTYALRAMAAGGELCDSQRCQVYIGSDAEYAAMDKAVAATSGEVLTYGKSLASAVYSANAGGHTADSVEGFGVNGKYPYLRAAPYLTEDRDEWTLTIALTDVARRLNYRGAIASVDVATRGASGRATAITLRGARGDKTVTGLEFDAALGLRSTLFTVKNVMAAKVAAITGGSLLQAPPESAATVDTAPSPAGATANAPAPISVRSAQSLKPKNSGVGFWSLVGAAVWGAVVVSAFRWRRVKGRGAHYLLS